jgi:two-component system sensor histidine kinase EvgS
MSHEIRTPMNAVIGMLELALKRADQGQLDRPAIEVAYSSAKDLLELIGDILDMTGFAIHTVHQRRQKDESPARQPDYRFDDRQSEAYLTRLICNLAIRYNS